ncbi:MAG TPA: CGGC domain-containing protein [Tissierellaceae bacterium]|nr:CGGC domain-containing protein [Tissierellaceae bacterium]
MKIAIGMCGKTSGKCSSMGCFRAYNNKDKHFTVYKDIETELMAFFSCNLCFENGEEKLNNIANRLKKNRVDKLHLGACALKCKEDRLKEIKKVFIDLGIDVVEGTH